MYLNLFLTPKAQKFSKKFPFEPQFYQKCPDMVQIDKDIPRTMQPPGLTDPQKERFWSALRAVLTGYCNFNKSVGYVQGMNILVSALLYAICDNWDRVEEAVEPALLLLVNLMEGYQLSDLFQKQMLRVLKLLKELEVRVEKELPKLFLHINKIEVA